MIYRAFWGEPCAEAAELEHGHMYHAPHPTNPATGEIEDTEVGFPGEGHHIAEQTWQMRIAMAALAVLAVIAGVVYLPFGITDWLGNFLEPTFADSIVQHPANDGLEAFGLVLTSRDRRRAHAPSVPHLGRRARAARRRPGALPGAPTPVREQVVLRRADRRSPSCGRSHGSAAGAVTPSSASSSTAPLVGGTSGIVRAGSAAVRALQTGLLRGYAALVIGGLSGVLLYLLLRAA